MMSSCAKYLIRLCDWVQSRTIEILHAARFHCRGIYGVTTAKKQRSYSCAHTHTHMRAFYRRHRPAEQRAPSPAAPSRMRKAHRKPERNSAQRAQQFGAVGRDARRSLISIHLADRTPANRWQKEWNQIYFIIIGNGRKTAKCFVAFI